MPIGCYTGLPRSGKTYQVVSHVVLAALRQGRRVVTNVSGIQEHLIRDYLIADGVPEGEIGEVVQVSNAEVLAEHFFCTDSDLILGVNSFVQAGDLVALDEVWRFWPKRGKIPDRHMNFMRMHGHFAHAQSGLICEVVLISQSIRDVNENIRDVIDETYRMTKDTAVGSDRSFNVQVFARGSESSRDEIRSFKGMYNPVFFAFYKSHSQAQAGTIPKEEKVDQRGNILKGPLFRYVIPIMCVVGVWGVWKVISYFRPAAAVPVVVPAAGQGPAGPGGVPAAVPVASGPSVSAWRVVGFLARPEDAFVLLEKDGIMRRDYEVEKYKSHGDDVSGLLEGARVAHWSGAKPAGLLK